MVCSCFLSTDLCPQAKRPCLKPLQQHEWPGVNLGYVKYRDQIPPGRHLIPTASFWLTHVLPLDRDKTGFQSVGSVCSKLY